MTDSQDTITIDILKAEKRYNIFKTIIIVTVIVIAASMVVWQVNRNTNRTYGLLRCVLSIQAKEPEQVRAQINKCVNLTNPSTKEEL